MASPVASQFFHLNKLWHHRPVDKEECLIKSGSFSGHR
jgi:hypothetical protein